MTSTSVVTLGDQLKTSYRYQTKDMENVLCKRSI